MSDTSIEIPLGQFDLGLLPTASRQPGTEAFRDAVTAFFQAELRPVAERIQIGVDDKTIRVAWRSKADADPLEQAIGRLKSGDYGKGIQILRLLRKARPGDAAVAYNLGMALSDQGQLDEAVQILQGAAEQHPDGCNILVALGVAQYRSRNLAEAKKALEAAIAIEPDNPYALRNLGGCLVALGQDLDRAEECLRKSVAALPQDQQGWVGLGQVLEQRGNLEEADDAYKKTLEINFNNQVAEVAKMGRSRIAQANMRQAASGDVRPDAMMYCLGALQKIETMSDAEVQKIGFEIAALGMKGINPTDSKKRYTLRTLPGEFTGLQLLSWMFVTWKRLKPDADIGFDLGREYQAALALHKPPQP
jgi:tetratricopeptide (TPR) repeat protein